MERVIFGGTCAPFRRVSCIRRVKRRIACERFVLRFGLGLNAVVIGIIVYAEIFLR